MRPESRKYLWDALQAADRIAKFVANRTFDAYQEDDQLRSAVERQVDACFAEFALAAGAAVGCRRIAMEE